MNTNNKKIEIKFHKKMLKKKRERTRSRITFLQIIEVCQKEYVYKTDGNIFSSVKRKTGGGACGRGDGV